MILCGYFTGMNVLYLSQKSSINSSLPSSQSLYPMTPLCIAGSMDNNEASMVEISFFTLIYAHGLRLDLVSFALSSKSKYPLCVLLECFKIQICLSCIFS